MDKRYRNNRIYHQKIQNQQKAIFLPMLCSRTSTRNVCLPRSQDPSSPKISCIGQAMRNNKIISFPRRIHHPDLNYFKLKRLFSGKNPSSSANPVTTSTNYETVKRDLGKKDARSDQVINVVDLDPPLPVMIKKRVECDKAENLWKRRLGGLELTSLRLKAPSDRHLSVQPTTA